MRYTVDPDDFAVRIYQDDEDVPFQFQPNYPNTDPFDSVEEASTWAELSIAAHSPEVMEYAPNGKGLVPELKEEYRPETIAANAARAEILIKLGITAEEAKLLLGDKK